MNGCCPKIYFTQCGMRFSLLNVHTKSSYFSKIILVRRWSGDQATALF